jgi:hypothetical protein
MAATKLVAFASLILLAVVSAPAAFAQNDGSGGITTPSARSAPPTIDAAKKAKRAERRAARKAARKAARDPARRAQQPPQF